MAVSIQNITPLALSWYPPMIAAAALVLAYEARGAGDVVVDAQLQGNALAISAHATIRAPLSAIWHTLIDYDHLTEFIPV